MRFFSSLLTFAPLCLQHVAAFSPFLLEISKTEHVFGNSLWNITMGQIYGKKLFYKNRDIIGNAVGHYVGHSGETNHNWTSVRVASQTQDYIDVVCEAKEGDFHWVIFEGEAGAYQYYVNKALPVLGEFRSLFRLDNITFPKGKTKDKDDVLPSFALIQSSTNVQDETWESSDGKYITKYDWSGFLREQEYYGVYGTGFGSWYIHPAKEDFNGDHLKQELLVHRESKTGDAVQLNMLHGGHFQASASDAFAVGKIWGPWLWYLNDGSISDVAERAQNESNQYPYDWFNVPAYQSRGKVAGTLKLSDGRPASGAAVFLGDNNPNESTLSQGRFKYYTTYADDNGKFEFEKVQSSVYAIQAWSNGGKIGDVSTTFLQNDVKVVNNSTTQLNTLSWNTSNRKKIWQIGDFDRKSLGFKNGGAPRQHGLAASSPADLTFIPGTSPLSTWNYVQSALGTWTVSFNLASTDIPNANADAVLIVSLAGCSTGVSTTILFDGVQIGDLTSAEIKNDPSVYRSGTTAGEWWYFEFEVPARLLGSGKHNVAFKATQTSRWRGFMWDAVALEWA